MKLKEYMAQARGHAGRPQSREEELCWEWEFRDPPDESCEIIGYLQPPGALAQRYLPRVVYFGAHKWDTPISHVTISEYPCVATETEYLRRKDAAPRRGREGRH